jgi:GAF domain-containing protein
LGPFQGKVACNVIEVGKGVCGSSAKTGKTIVVPDVNKFPGHIACDEASRSEVVVPVFVNQKLYGVLDIDSAKLNRFQEKDVKLFEEATIVVSKHLSK